MVEEKSLRLLLFRQGVPEVDYALDDLDPLPCQCEIRACVATWQARAEMPSGLNRRMTALLALHQEER